MGETGTPEILARYETNLQGMLEPSRVTSKVFLRNFSTAKAYGCRFDFDNSGMLSVLSYAEFSRTGTNAALPNAPFDLAPGQERGLRVTTAGGSIPFATTAGEVQLRCANQNTSISTDALSAMNVRGQVGLLTNLAITTAGTDDYKRLKVAPNTVRRVVVALKNTGEYSGDFTVSYTDDASFDRLADVTSVCVSNETGTCLGPSITETSFSINSAPGETTYLAMKVARGATVAPGIVALRTEAFTPEGRLDTGSGGFEVLAK